MRGSPQDAVSMIVEAHLRAGGQLCLTVEDAGKMIGVGKTKSYELVSTGDIPSIQIGGKRMVSLRQLLEYVERLEQCGRNRWKKS